MQADMLALAPGWEEARHLHNFERDGYVAIREGSRATGRNTYLKLADLPERLFDWMGRSDVFISQASFHRPWKSNDTVRALQTVWSDLDSYKKECLPLLSPESQADRVMDFCDVVGLLPPSLIVFSGQGLQCKWLLTAPLPGGAALERWRAVQDAICRTLAPLGADSAARSPSQIFRMVGSVNSKTLEVVRILFINKTVALGAERLSSGVVGYDFDLLADEVLAISRSDLQKAQAAKSAKTQKETEEAAERVTQAPIAGVQNNPNALGKKHRTRAQAKYGPGFGGLARDRLRDLYTLAKIRWRKGEVPRGKRDTFVFLAACFLACCTTAIDLEREIRCAAAQLSPTWSYAEVRACVSSVLDRSKKHLAGQQGEYKGQFVPLYYRWRNETLLEMLEITKDEERKLQTIISQEEVLRRKRTKQLQVARAAGIKPRTQYLSEKVDKAARAVLLKSSGVSTRDIAIELGVSARTVQAYCAAK